MKKPTEVKPATRKQLETSLAVLREDNERLRTLLEAEQGEAKMARKLFDDACRSTGKIEAEAKELRERLDDLKARYAESRYELARLTGYLDRVYEDDVVREPVVEIADHDQNPAIRRTQPKRPIPIRPLGMQDGPMGHGGASIATDRAYVERRNNRPRHWAQY